MQTPEGGDFVPWASVLVVLLLLLPGSRLAVAVPELPPPPPPPLELEIKELSDFSPFSPTPGAKETETLLFPDGDSGPDEIEESDVEEDQYDDTETETRSKASYSNYTDQEYDRIDSIMGEPSDRALMRQLPPEEQLKIQQHVEDFRLEKAKLDREIAKWDDSGNDIIILAKQMCMIMMEMTDFTRGRGPLKSTMDVINAAKKISEAGTNLDKLARTIADQCPDSRSKEDLKAYLKSIALFTHQLNITGKVKSDVITLDSGEVLLSGLDSATSLIQAAKNLMNAVVLTVKASYVASTKYQRSQKGVNSPVVLWKMKPPEKKALVRREDPEEITSKIRKSAKLKTIHVVKELSEFTEIDSF
ncbi:catenin alpha-2-like [Lingula anatina]|uniref:Catenin alpha-2-like n=1 Tax=Lingula anatina TaxID=7574 RepID=A0A1S3KBA6_LINAN|nr:catenin alpha-2-like [Lingula anatina]|eukprot:XP_013419772.1 catenin alpha-2-like [Lingula anatina]